MKLEIEIDEHDIRYLDELLTIKRQVGIASMNSILKAVLDAYEKLVEGEGGGA